MDEYGPKKGPEPEITIEDTKISKREKNLYFRGEVSQSDLLYAINTPCYKIYKNILPYLKVKYSSDDSLRESYGTSSLSEENNNLKKQLESCTNKNMAFYKKRLENIHSFIYKEIK
jgi:hypothetical protein